MRTRLGERYCRFDRHDLRGAVLSTLHFLDDFSFRFDGRRRGEPASGLVPIIGNPFELAGGDTRLEAGADLRVGHLAHASAQRIYIESAFVYDGLTLETLIASEGDSLTYLLAALLC